MADKENEMKYPSDHDEVIPPELRESGVPPLKKTFSWVAIGIGIALLIVLAFSVYFYLINKN